MINQYKKLKSKNKILKNTIKKQKKKSKNDKKRDFK